MKTILSVLLFFIGNANALELQIKPRTTDKTNYISPSTEINKGLNVYTDFSLSTKPLQRSQGNTKYQLIDSLLEWDTSLTYGLNKKTELGLSMPVQTTFGDYQDSYLSNPLFEIKYKLLENVVVIPQLYLPISQEIFIKENGVDLPVIMGAEKGGAGIKVSTDLKTGTNLYLGYASFPENEYRNIDQSSKIQYGVHQGIDMSDIYKVGIGIYGEKTPSQNPLEALSYIQYKKGNFSILAGAGIGNLQEGEDKTYKVFSQVSYYFGNKSEDEEVSRREVLKEYRAPREKRKAPIIQIPQPSSRGPSSVEIETIETRVVDEVEFKDLAKERELIKNKFREDMDMSVFSISKEGKDEIQKVKDEMERQRLKRIQDIKDKQERLKALSEEENMKEARKRLSLSETSHGVPVGVIEPLYEDSDIIKISTDELYLAY